MGFALNATIRLRSDASANWIKANPILQAGEPGFEVDTLKFKIGNGVTDWQNLPYISGENEIITSNNAILTVSQLPEIGNPTFFYKVEDTQKIYFWNTQSNNFSPINFDIEIPEVEVIDNILLFDDKTNFPENGLLNILYKDLDEQTFYFWNETKASYDKLIQDIPSFVDTNTDNIVVENSISFFPEVGLDNLLYKALDELKLYFWNSNTSLYEPVYKEIQLPEIEDKNTDNIIVSDSIDLFPAIGENNILYKALDTQKIYFWNSNSNEYEILKGESISNNDNIKVVDILPDVGEENILYKLSSELKFYFWNTKENAFNLLTNSAEVIIPEVKGGIEVADTISDLPEQGKSDMLYKVLENEKVYTWDASNNEYSIINKDALPSGGGGIVVVNTFAELPEIGAADTLYKVLTDLTLYNYNTLTNAYEKMGQASGPAVGEGYNITLQSTIDRIFAAIEGDPVVLGFRYSSVDSDGLNDGPGIGTLTINGVKKANIAVPQKVQTLDITKYLTLGENNIELRVENSEGAEKAKTLTYSIELVNLSLKCDVRPMAIYDGDVSIPFLITGSGTKKLTFLIDDEEFGTDEITSTNVYKYTLRIPMLEAGAHILKIYAEREVNNMTIRSNEIILGMMFVTEEMVDTHILSTFNQTESTQGEIITIPYMVYNPFLLTANVVLTIYNNDDSIYFQKEIVVDLTVLNWVTQDYPAGNIKFKILAHSDSGIDAEKIFTLNIAPSVFDLEVVKDSLELEFSALGRSNSEKNPAVWNYGSYEGSFDNFAWSGADGWVESDSGETVLRFLAGNKMTIPFYPFATDKRSTGYSIEFELESRDVTDYDAVIVSCMSGGRGFEIKSQSVLFKSALSEVSMMYKEDERVRITIVVEPTTLDRIIYMFINGIICGITQYANNDNFQQTIPVPITIGSDKSGIDLYKVRFYNRSLTFSEQLNNFICDRSTNAERFKLKDRNDIFDISGNITISSLPPEIPYLVMLCEELPQYKGDKKKDKNMYFVDQLRPDRCFSATGCQFNVQGTSSAGYPIKNFKIDFKKGILLPNGETAAGYPILEDGLLSACLCLKADYASSEQANNVVLVEYYDRLVRDYFLTPPQKLDPKVRVGVSSRPIVMFWENTTTGEITFQGQYNMNNDKSNENVFGFNREVYPNLECWEFSNNTSNRCLFIESEYEKTVIDEEKNEEYPAWTADFEARFPDTDPAYQDYTQFKRLTDWIVSTRRELATNKLLPEAITYGSNTYTNDTAEYRLDKFKYEFDNYLIKEPILFYYLFTETFLMIDSRAKNMFMTTFDGTHWFPIPYDFDTAIGINNEGKLVFEYDLEDTDVVNNELVFNGQESTLWMNVRDAFKAELFDLYDKLRTSGKFSYETINKMMTDHLEICWPEAIWNADARVKYVDVFLRTGNNYFEMCQGNKKTLREWWLYNAFKYRDSKYRTGDAQKIIASFRAYGKDNAVIVPYQNLWPRVDYTDSYPVTNRSKRNIENTMICPLDTVNDTEIFIRSADRIASFGDLSKFKPDTVKFAGATKLLEVILGSSEEGYLNHKLSSVELGTNRLLKTLNVENCINLSKTIDVSQCFNLEIIKAYGSILPSIILPSGGHLKELYLPASFNDFTIKNQHMLEVFNMESYENLESICIDDTPGLPIEDLLLNTPRLNRVRIVNITWQVSNEDNLRTIFEKLKTCAGIDANGNNTSKAVMTGYVLIDSISDEFLEELNETFTELIVVVNGRTRFFLRYVNWDNTLLYKYAVSLGSNAIDPVANKLIETPTREGGEDSRYTYTRWSDLPTNVQVPQTIVAMYDTEYRVQFLDGDSKVVDTLWITKELDAVDPTERAVSPIKIPTKTSTEQYDFVFSGWDKEFKNILAPLNVNATFSNFLRSYQVYFYNDSELLLETTELYGTCPVYEGDTTLIKKTIGGEVSDYYEFACWSPDLTTPIKGDTYYYAQFAFDGFIEDDWTTIANNCANGQADNYGFGGKKIIDLNFDYNSVNYAGTIEAEIIDKHHDELENTDPSYASSSTTAGLTFRCIMLIKLAEQDENGNDVYVSFKRTLNNSGKNHNGDNTLNAGGWKLTDAREWLNNTFIEYLPLDLRSCLKSVKKLSDQGYTDKTGSLIETYDKIFIPALEELNISDKGHTNLGQGTPYILYTDDTSRKLSESYWTRSTYKSGLHSFCTIPNKQDKSSIGTSGGGNSLLIVFCFCV